MRPQTDQQIEDYWSKEGYLHARKLPSGEVAALCPFLFTVGLCVGLEETGYRTRFCYPDYDSAKKALDNWHGEGVPSGDFIKQKGLS